ncbi:Long-chain-fatty-acid--CoA ligase 5 [Toxocara canis]|uniref:long-chain-fatty-acid--CoA ligase n=1 Tax=Toxocara canis TaxID=6265 RepID=A0A0B2V7Z1_TOXCA|nr:Long-chain-fatty-acid--CoA ligase 5 [Toxocara canis]
MEWSVSEFWDQNATINHQLLGLAAALTAGTAALLWLRSASPPKLKATVDLNYQTKQLPDGSRVAAFIDNGQLKEYLFEDSRTLYQAIRRGLRESKNGPMLGYRMKQPGGTAPYVWLSYQEVIDRSVHLSHGISAMGIKPGQETFIGIYSKNRPEWVISEYAAYNNSCVIVSLYDTLGIDARCFIIEQCAIQLVICDTSQKAASLIVNKGRCHSLKFIIVVDEYSSILEAEGKEVGIAVVPFVEVERLGRETTAKSALIVPKPDDLCTICYTSGTTGTPKGVMLTHANVIAASLSLDHFPNSRTCADDTSISYLPLAHMYERLLHCIGYQVGARIGFFGGDIRNLVDDIKELRPTVIPLVPRVLHRFYDSVMAEVNKSMLKRVLFNLALAYKSRQVSRGIIRHDSWLDRIIFKRIREELGGRMRFMIIGSAPVDGDVLRFARAAFGCVIVEGYGTTECAAATSAVIEADPVANHVGIPLACAAIKLVDVPELGYYARDKGEFVAPDRIESIYDRSQYVLQSFVYGESLKTCLIAIVVPQEEVIMRVSQEKLGMKSMKYEQILRSADVKKMIFEDMLAVGQKAGLNSFEQVKDIYISSERFTVANDLLTPTMKNKRPQIKKYFATQLAEMYSKLN